MVVVLRRSFFYSSNVSVKYSRYSNLEQAFKRVSLCTRCDLVHIGRPRRKSDTSLYEYPMPYLLLLRV